MNVLSAKNVQYCKFETASDVGSALIKEIIETGFVNFQSKSSFNFAVSGGSMVKLLTDLPQKLLEKEPVEQLKKSVDENKAKIFFCDERKVAPGNEDSTYGAYKKNWAGTPLESAMVPIDDTIALDECAKDYEQKILEATGESLKLDLVLLGIGPDGHTCSLFPNHSLLKDSRVGVLSISDSPKPPPERVTLSLAAVKAATKKIVFATGSGKQPIVKRVLVDGEVSEDIPVSLVSSSDVEVDTSVLWMVDSDSSKDLSL